MPIVLIVFAALLLSPAAAGAQSRVIEGCDSFKQRVDAIVSADRASREAVNRAVLTLLDVGQNSRCYLQFVVEHGVERIALIDVLRRFESSRTDKQSGTAGSGGGSTSIVSQGPVAKVLSFAAEYGALTQSVNGQVITVRGNAAGLPTALVNHNDVPYCVPQDRTSGFCIDSSLLGVLRRFSFTVAFNATQQPAAVGTPQGQPSAAGQQVTFEATTNQVASWGLRVELKNDRDAKSAAFRAKFREQSGAQLGNVSAALMKQVSAAVQPAFDSGAYDQWQQKHLPLVAGAGNDRQAIVEAFDIALSELYPIMEATVPDLQENATAALGAFGSFFIKQDELIATIATKTVWALEFTKNRPTSQPHTLNARVILDWPLTQKQKLVANGAATWFDESQVNTDGVATRFRDAQAGAQYELGLGDLAIIGPATLSAAFYYQYQHAPALLKVDPAKPIPGVTFINLPDTAKTVFAEKGDLYLGQVKLSLTPKDSSIKVPFAVSLSNRTELIKTPKKVWKAQVGVTYDFDSLFARDK